MPLGEVEVDDSVISSADWDGEATCRAVESVRLVLRLQQEATEVRDGCRLPHSRASPAQFQCAEGDLESGRDVLLVHLMLLREPSVRSLDKPGPGTYVLPKRDSNRLVDNEPELREESEEGRGQRSCRERQGSNDVRNAHGKFSVSRDFRVLRGVE